MNIITLTLNPAIDVHLRADSISVGGYSKADFERRDPAGKGVNVSRALSAFGVDNLCYVVLGADNSAEYLSSLASQGIAPEYSLVPGRVRENMNVQHRDSETVIAMDGAPLGRAAIDRVKDDLVARIKEDTVLCFCGSLSDLTDKEAVLSMLYEFKRLGAKLVIDSRSLTAEEIIPLAPYLIKPNEGEALALTGMSASDPRGAAKIAEALRDMGCENVLVTLGANGAALASQRGTFIADSPKISAVSTVGAGDSTVAGFLASGTNGDDALRLAMAFGSAACLAEGSTAPDPCQIKRLANEITVTELER